MERELTLRTSRTWNEHAFVDRALPALTEALGIHLLLDNLGRYHRLHPDQSEVAFLQPETVQQLRTEWLTDAARHFPQHARQWLDEAVVSAADFRISLIGHLDQVQVSLKPTPLVRNLRRTAVLFAIATVTLALVLGLTAVYREFSQPLLIATEVMACASAAVWVAYLVVQDRFRTTRTTEISNSLRSELRQAIFHGFARPVSKVAAETLSTG